MSHYTVLAVITPDRLERCVQELVDPPGDPEERLVAGIHAAVAELLRPYQEDDCPEEFLEFEEAEAKHAFYDWELRECEVTDPSSLFYAGPSPQQVKDVVGMKASDFLMRCWEESEGFEGRSEGLVKKLSRHGFPWTHLGKVGVPALLAVCAHGYYVEETPGGDLQFGYYHNPNAKWDFYRVGGRWPGSLLLKDGVQGIPRAFMEGPRGGRADAARVKDLDRERYEEETRRKIQDFWRDYQVFKANGGVEGGQPQDPFGVTFDMGMMGCPDGVLTLEEVETKYRWYFEWKTFAVVDDSGWHSKGEMGWFCLSTDTASDRQKWNTEFFDRFILGQESPECWVAVIDCHI